MRSAALLAIASSVCLDSTVVAARENKAAVFHKVIEAEAFTEGNVRIDRDVWGEGIGVLHVREKTKPSGTAFVQYTVSVPHSGPYEIDLRYASSKRYPLRLVVNGELREEPIAQDTTTGEKPDQQTWYVESMVRLDRGVNTLRLESSQGFPLLDKLAIRASEEPLVIEAERFHRGNVRVDDDDRGKGIGVLRSGEQTPCFVEYQVECEQTGFYQLDLRYAQQPQSCSCS